jgi:hypothetical protein
MRAEEMAMARKLKTYQTSLGFFDQAIAAPSIKAALEAWGADSSLFHQGAAGESDDPDVIRAIMAKPGVVLKRPVGSKEPFGEHAGLPTDLGRGGKSSDPVRKPAARKAKPGRTADAAAERKAALAYEREQKRRERDRAKEEAAARKDSERRQVVVKKAQEALDLAERRHDEKAAAIQAEREVVDERASAEDVRWGKEHKRLREALKRARD